MEAIIKTGLGQRSEFYIFIEIEITQTAPSGKENVMKNSRLQFDDGIGRKS
jgi:hypothetical protein